MLNYNHFLNKYDGTCSIDNLKVNHITFIRLFEYTKKLTDFTYPLCVIAPNRIKGISIDHVPDMVRFRYVDDVDYEFTIIHNMFYENTPVMMPDISSHTNIHRTVIIDVEGLKVAIGKNNEKIQFIHTGGVQINSDVEIGPYTVIHKASMDMTIINKGVKIGAHCNIGHNNIIGENTIIAAGVMTSGSVKIGKNCWLGTGSLIRNGINICDDTVIGIGSVVVKDIKIPGIYAGNPAKYLREKPDNWNF